MTTQSTYALLCAELKRLDKLESIGGVLGWDEQVNLPPGSADLRAEQNAVYSELVHREWTRPQLGEWIASLRERSGELDEGARRVVEEAGRKYDERTKLPPEFVARKAAASSRAYQAWVAARGASDYASYEPHLREQIELALEQAAHLGREADPYNYWIDQFDPGMTQAAVEALFTPLREELVPLVRQIVESPVKPDESLLRGFPVDAQEVFLREVITRLGFDFKRGRLDRAVHPFCGGHPLDVRLTTRFHVDNPLDSLFSSVHETGHGLYEQGLPPEHVGTALGEAAGMAAHESQSRIWENQVARSRAFWRYWEPRYRELFADRLDGVESDALYLAVNAVAISPIRVDSDEVTYNLHIMLRFELEKRLMDRSLDTRDLPGAWNELSAQIVGHRPRNDREGCLQDVHWSGGAFGYFPSYTLGNLLAAQLWETVNKQIPDLQERFAEGDYRPLLDWLRQNVHALGKRYKTDALARRVTGTGLSIHPLLRYLREHYLPLYTA